MKSTKKNTEHSLSRSKTRLDAVTCTNGECVMFEKEMRSKYTLQLTKGKKKCTFCESDVEHKERRTHDEYKYTYFLVSKRSNLPKKIKNNPLIAPKMLHAGLISCFCAQLRAKSNIVCYVLFRAESGSDQDPFSGDAQRQARDETVTTSTDGSCIESTSRVSSSGCTFETSWLWTELVGRYWTGIDWNRLDQAKRLQT
ncbi:hypothetical protein EDC96DRAFT_544007 [Choanephora cucurbitarum]|nr:hypothetical protein EDC96DRAFT_544007 [Choanephora cucurbitarum]